VPSMEGTPIGLRRDRAQDNRSIPPKEGAKALSRQLARAARWSAVCPVVLSHGQVPKFTHLAHDSG